MIIVEDEPLIRQGIKEFLDWDAYGIAIIGDASDGDAAIEIVKRNPPDLLLTDIRMPGMDGLALIEKLKETIPDCIFIILSGYDDFEYARQAISLGVSYYILKPLKEDNFSRIISESAQKCHKVQLLKSEEKRLTEKLSTSIPTLRDNYILNILHGNISPNKASLAELEIDLTNPFYATAAVRLAGKPQRQMVHRFMFILKEKIQETVEDYCKEHKQNIKKYILIDNDTVILIISFCELCDNTGMMISIFSGIRKKMNDLYDDDLLFGAGSMVEELNGLFSSVTEAEKVLEYKILRCNGNFIFFKEIEENKFVKPAILTVTERKKLLAAVNQGDYEYIHSAFELIKKELSGMQLLPPGYLNFMLLDIVISTVRNLYEDGFQVDRVFDMRIFSYNFLTMFESLDELIGWAEEFITNLSVSFGEYKSNKPRKVLEDIKKYILENIDQEISLNSISQKFYYNSSYISRIFKEELNYNFLNFVMNQKIEYAARLLLETNLKYTDICEKVGYHDYKHFSSIFKSIKGMTPSEYKKRGCMTYEF